VLALPVARAQLLAVVAIEPAVVVAFAAIVVLEAVGSDSIVVVPMSTEVLMPLCHCVLSRSMSVCALSLVPLALLLPQDGVGAALDPSHPIPILSGCEVLHHSCWLQLWWWWCE
jgi:hypothetical protein